MTPPNIPDRALRDLGIQKPKPSTPALYDPVTGEPWEPREDQDEEQQDDTTETYESEQGKRGHTQQ